MSSATWRRWRRNGATAQSNTFSAKPDTSISPWCRPNKWPESEIIHEEFSFVPCKSAPQKILVGQHSTFRPDSCPFLGYGYRFTALWTEICLRDPTVRLQKCSAAHPPRGSALFRWAESTTLLIQPTRPVWGTVRNRVLAGSIRRPESVLPAPAEGRPPSRGSGVPQRQDPGRGRRDHVDRSPPRRGFAISHQGHCRDDLRTCARKGRTV